MEDLAPKLTYKQFYFVFDIKDGFYHTKLDEKSTEYYSINTVYDIYIFKSTFWFESKMQYCIHEVKYLEMIFNKYGINSIPDKILVIRELKYSNNTIEFS